MRENFDADALRERLRRSGALLLAALSDVGTAEARRRPAPGTWSPLEIAVHLVDEEREDFRARLRATLDDPTGAWAPIDPEGWVLERRYADRELEATLAEFELERANSIEWLTDMRGVDWGRAHSHPKLGTLRAGDLLAAWAAHDLLHLAQLGRTRARLIAVEVEPYSTRYAMP